MYAVHINNWNDQFWFLGLSGTKLLIERSFLEKDKIRIRECTRIIVAIVTHYQTKVYITAGPNEYHALMILKKPSTKDISKCNFREEQTRHSFHLLAWWRDHRCLCCCFFVHDLQQQSVTRKQSVNATVNASNHTTQTATVSSYIFQQLHKRSSLTNRISPLRYASKANILLRYRQQAQHSSPFAFVLSPLSFRSHSRDAGSVDI